MTSDGASTSCGASRRSVRPALMMLPQVTTSGLTPAPRIARPGFGDDHDRDAEQRDGEHRREDVRQDLTDHDPTVLGALGARGQHELALGPAERRGARDAREHRDGDDGEGQGHVEDRAVEVRGDRQREDQGREGEQDVGDGPERGADPAAEVAGDQPEDPADDEADDDREQPDRERVAAAPDHPGEEVAPVGVDAEEVVEGRAGAVEAGEDVLVRVGDRQDRGEDRRPDDQRQEDDRGPRPDAELLALSWSLRPRPRSRRSRPAGARAGSPSAARRRRALRRTA